MLSRLVVLIHLAILCVSLNCLFPQSSLATGVSCKILTQKSAPKAGQLDLPTWDIQGWGEHVEDAQQTVAEKVCQLTTEYLKRQNPQLTWSPSPEYVRKHLSWSAAERKEEDDQDVPVAGKKVNVKSWAWSVSVTPTNYDEMLREDGRVRAQQYRQEREVRAQDRMLLLAKLLAIAVAGLLAAVAYIRVDEWTKGHYSRWLAIAGGSFLIVVTLGLWFSTRTWNW